MKRALIVTGGDAPSVELLKISAARADILIAADSGAEAVHRAGLIPDLLVGDMDSVTKETLLFYNTQNVKTCLHPVRKDDTDTALALSCALEMGADELELLGAGGGRCDHLMANWMLLLRMARCGVPCLMQDDVSSARVVTGAVCFSGRIGAQISIFPMGGPAYVHSTTGLSYPMREQWMPCDNPYGISNVLTETEAQIRIDDGYVLVLQEK